MLVFDAESDAILEAFRSYSPPAEKWKASSNFSEPKSKVIRIVAALVRDEEQPVLLVRKTGTRAFMQPGGKLRDSESHLAALERELGEELKCSVRPGSPVFLGTLSAPAANETGFLVEAALYRVELVGAISAASEIEEIVWIDPAQPHCLELTPLTRETVVCAAVSVPTDRLPPSKPSVSSVKAI
jgi:8-oxo-dGTP pyrophosphatase MutT (NUDIX family)